MRIRLADYVANFLVEHGVTDVFSVVGGGAMPVSYTHLTLPTNSLV